MEMSWDPTTRMGFGLSEDVEAAVDRAVDLVLETVEELRGGVAAGGQS